MARPQVDVDDVAAIAQRYGVSSMPTFVLLRGAGAAAAGADGGPALLGRFSGADPERLRASVAAALDAAAAAAPEDADVADKDGDALEDDDDDDDDDGGDEGVECAPAQASGGG